MSETSEKQMGEPDAVEEPRSKAESPRKHLWLLAAGCVALVALVETVASWVLAGPPASKENWRQAAKTVRGEFKEGDLLLFAPKWIDPKGRLHLGDLLDLNQMSRPDEAAFSRIWVVGLQGQRRSETGDARLLKRHQLGDLEVSLYERSTDPALYDFYEKIHEATVQMVRPDGSISQICPYDRRRRRHQCRAGWNNVRQKLAEVDFTLRRCLYAHPVDKETLEIHFPKAQLGTRLVIYTGLDGYDPRLKARRAVYLWKNPEKRKGKNKGKRDPRGPRELKDVRLRVLVNGKEVGVVNHPIDDRWRRNVLDTSKWSGSQGPVVFQISTKWAYSKVFCFYAQSRK